MSCCGGELPPSGLPASAFANPTGLIGLTAVNGVSTSAERNDSRHALDQAIAPVWAGAHKFSVSAVRAGHVVPVSFAPEIIGSVNAGAGPVQVWNSAIIPAGNILVGDEVRFEAWGTLADPIANRLQFGIFDVTAASFIIFIDSGFNINLAANFYIRVVGFMTGVGTMRMFATIFLDQTPVSIMFPIQQQLVNTANDWQFRLDTNLVGNSVSYGLLDYHR
jgi:hypothetical protein